MRGIVYLDGAFVDEHEALISPVDAGVIYGLGSFETLRLYAGRPFLPERHGARLHETLKHLGIPMPPLDLDAIFRTLATRNALGEARGRVLVTGGTERAGGRLENPRSYADVTPLGPDPVRGRGGVKVVFASRELRPIAGFKSLSYLPNALARREARLAGAEEALLRSSSGEILEGATSNVGLVIDGVVTTPPADGRVLSGVTRGVVLEEAHSLGIAVEERSIGEIDVDRADEAFLTSTLREVVPIAELADRRFEAPGPLTTRLLAAYRRRVSAALSISRPAPRRPADN